MYLSMAGAAMLFGLAAIGALQVGRILFGAAHAWRTIARDQREEVESHTRQVMRRSAARPIRLIKS